MIPTRISVRSVVLLTAGLALLGAAACDVPDPLEGVDLIVDVPDAPVELDAASGTVSIEPGRTVATNSTVANETDIETVRELRSVRLDPSFFSFESSAITTPAGTAAAGAARASGTIVVAVFLNGVPVPGFPVEITVVEDEVTDVSPGSIPIATAEVDAVSLRALLDDLPADETPPLEAWEEMSLSDIIARINQGLADRDLPVSVVVRSEELGGTFRIQRFEFDAQVSISN